MDPHALALLYQSRVVSQVYDSLVNRDREFRLEPALATRGRWSTRAPGASPCAEREVPRRHADDRRRRGVLDRRRWRRLAARLPAARLTGARRVDELTVDVLLAAPDAVLQRR